MKKSYLLICKDKEQNTFTHDDKEYSLPRLDILVKNIPVSYIHLNKLKWIFKYDDPYTHNPERIKSCYYSAPIIVTMWQGKFTVLDGLHRIAKAKRNGDMFMRAKIVGLKHLSQIKII